MNYRNAKYIGDDRIDCEIEHPSYGWIPFTCDRNDAGALLDVVSLYDAMMADPNTAAYTPAPVSVPASISFAQLLIGLVAEGFITEAEGEAWLAGTLPAAVLLVIDGLPADQRFAAKVRAIRPSEVLRSDPLVAAMNVAAGKTDEELDQFFRTYAGV